MLAGQYATSFGNINAELVAALVQGLHSGLDSPAVCQKLLAMEGMNAQIICYIMSALPSRLPDHLTACACVSRLCGAWPMDEACRQRMKEAFIMGGLFECIPELLKLAIQVTHPVPSVLHHVSLMDGHSCAHGNASSCVML